MRRQTLVSWFAFPLLALYLKAQVSASQKVAVCQSSCTEASVQSEQLSCLLQVEPRFAGPCVLENRLSPSFCCGAGTSLGIPVIFRGVRFMDQRWSLILFSHKRPLSG